MKDPVDLRDSNGNAVAWVPRILHHSGLRSHPGNGEVRVAKAGDQGQPRGHLIAVANECFTNAAGYRRRRRPEILAVRRAIGKNIIEVVVLVLGESVHAYLQVVILDGGDVQARL